MGTPDPFCQARLEREREIEVLEKKGKHEMHKSRDAQIDSESCRNCSTSIQEIGLGS